MVMEITLTTGVSVKVDAEDYRYLQEFSWYPSNRYASTRVGGELTYMHRMVTGAGEGEVVDHINGDILDNRRRNLRITTNQNNLRKAKMRVTNTSGYRGVSRYKNRWRSYAVSDGKQIHLGVFDTKEEAALAYNEGVSKLFGEFARFNEINEKQEGIN